jgi:SOS-response transcriptional repressor LexA
MGDSDSTDTGSGSSYREPPRLTATELRVFAVLEDMVDELGYAPTFAQMLARLGWSPKSKGSLHQYLERLRRHGLLEGTGRSLRVKR